VCYFAGEASGIDENFTGSDDEQGLCEYFLSFSFSYLEYLQIMVVRGNKHDP